MDSSREAFDKFSMWKKLQTPVRLIEITSSSTSKTLKGEIFHADFKTRRVGFSVFPGKSFIPFDLTGASFEVGPDFVKVFGELAPTLEFEELLTQ